MNCAASFKLLALVMLIAPCTGSRAEGLAAGHYRFTAPLGPVCLDGSYPFVIGDVPGGVLTLSMDPKGKLAGEIELWGKKQAVTGTLISLPKLVRLRIAGKDGRNRLSIKADLKGGAFVGTAVTRLGRAACSLDVTASAALAGVFDFLVAPDARGRLRGTGTLSASNQSLPITVVASNSKKQTSSLRLSAGRQWWQGAGLSKDDGFIAKWKAQGFGAITKGEGLKVSAD